MSQNNTELHVPIPKGLLNWEAFEFKNWIIKDGVLRISLDILYSELFGPADFTIKLHYMYALIFNFNMCTWKPYTSTRSYPTDYFYTFSAFKILSKIVYLKKVFSNQICTFRHAFWLKKSLNLYISESEGFPNTNGRDFLKVVLSERMFALKKAF